MEVRRAALRPVAAAAGLAGCGAFVSLVPRSGSVATHRDLGGGTAGRDIHVGERAG